MTTATTTPHETEPGPVVVPPAFLAMTSAAERFRQSADAFRDAITPTLLATERASRDAYALATASERVSKSLSASVRALQGLRRSGHPSMAFLHGRPEDLTRLDREARRVAHGNALLGVRIARLLGDLLVHGRTYTADLAALAFRGDAEAREEWETLAEDGEATALAVLDLLADLDALTAAADALAAEVAALVSAATLSDLPETAEPIPPPRITLAGSLDPHAPPVAASRATAGNVLTAGRSPMR